MSCSTSTKKIFQLDCVFPENTNASNLEVYIDSESSEQVVPTCSVGDDCSSKEVFQVRLLSSNRAEVKVPESFKLKGHFRCVTPEVRNPAKCSWPPLRDANSSKEQLQCIRELARILQNDERAKLVQDLTSLQERVLLTPIALKSGTQQPFNVCLVLDTLTFNTSDNKLVVMAIRFYADGLDAKNLGAVIFALQNRSNSISLPVESQDTHMERMNENRTHVASPVSRAHDLKENGLMICSTNNQKLSCVFPERIANASELLLYFKSGENITVVLTCTVNDDCKSGEGFQVRWIAHNHAEIRIPQNFKLHGTFKCVTKEVNNGSTCSWPPLKNGQIRFKEQLQQCTNQLAIHRNTSAANPTLENRTVTLNVSGNETQQLFDPCDLLKAVGFIQHSFRGNKTLSEYAKDMEKEIMDNFIKEMENTSLKNTSFIPNEKQDYQSTMNRPYEDSTRASSSGGGQTQSSAAKDIDTGIMVNDFQQMENTSFIPTERHYYHSTMNRPYENSTRASSPGGGQTQSSAGSMLLINILFTFPIILLAVAIAIIILIFWKWKNWLNKREVSDPLNREANVEPRIAERQILLQPVQLKVTPALMK